MTSNELIDIESLTDDDLGLVHNIPLTTLEILTVGSLVMEATHNIVNHVAGKYIAGDGNIDLEAAKEELDNLDVIKHLEAIYETVVAPIIEIVGVIDEE